MGYSYVSWVKTVILYSDLSGINEGGIAECVELGKRYKTIVIEKAGEKSVTLEDDIREYGLRRWFDGEWLCESDTMQRHVMLAMCKRYRVPPESLISITQELEGEYL
jgi:hypothetical protein